MTCAPPTECVGGEPDRDDANVVARPCAGMALVEAEVGRGEYVALDASRVGVVLDGAGVRVAFVETGVNVTLGAAGVGVVPLISPRRLDKRFVDGLAMCFSSAPTSEPLPWVLQQGASKASLHLTWAPASRLLALVEGDGAQSPSTHLTWGLGWACWPACPSLAAVV